MLNLLGKIWQQDEGQDLIEYMLLVSLISIAAILALTSLGTTVSGFFSSVVAQF